MMLGREEPWLPARFKQRHCEQDDAEGPFAECVDKITQAQTVVRCAGRDFLECADQAPGGRCFRHGYIPD